MNHKKTTKGHKKITSATRKPNEFGANLFRARNELGWSREELRQRTEHLVSKGVSENTIYNIEIGRSPGRSDIQTPIKKAISDELGRPYPWKKESDLLNKESLEKFINDSHLVNDLDQDLAAAYGVRLILPDSFSGYILDRLSHVGITTIKDVDRLLLEKKQMIKQFAIACYKYPVLRRHDLPRGACIGSLQVLLLLDRGQVAELKEYLSGNRLNIKANPSKMTDALVAAYAAAKSKLNS